MLATYAGDQGVENSSSTWYDLLNPSKRDVSRETSTPRYPHARSLAKLKIQAGCQKSTASFF